jgi:ketosteroid isomerase-like protein
MHHPALAAALLSLIAAAATAQPAHAPGDVMSTITRMTTAVNHGEMPTAFAAFTANPTITDDLAPYRWQGAGAPQAWITAMGANAQARGIAGIDMQLSAATRVEVADDRAYALVPGRLTFTMKDGRKERADGLLTFTLQRSAAEWKIDTLAWSGPPAKP